MNLGMNFFQYFKNICLQDVSTEILLVNIAFTEDYVKASEVRKDHAPHVLSKGGNLELEHNGTAWVQGLQVFSKRFANCDFLNPPNQFHTGHFSLLLIPALLYLVHHS